MARTKYATFLIMSNKRQDRPSPASKYMSMAKTEDTWRVSMRFAYLVDYYADLWFGTEPASDAFVPGDIWDPNHIMTDWLPMMAMLRPTGVQKMKWNWGLNPWTNKPLLKDGWKASFVADQYYGFGLDLTFPTPSRAYQLASKPLPVLDIFGTVPSLPNPEFFDPATVVPASPQKSIGPGWVQTANGWQWTGTTSPPNPVANLGPAGTGLIWTWDPNQQTWARTSDPNYHAAAGTTIADVPTDQYGLGLTHAAYPLDYSRVPPAWYLITNGGSTGYYYFNRQGGAFYGEEVTIGRFTYGTTNVLTNTVDRFFYPAGTFDSPYNGLFNGLYTPRDYVNNP